MQTIIGRFASSEDVSAALRELQAYQPALSQPKPLASRHARMELGVVIGIAAGLALAYLTSPGLPDGGVLTNLPVTHLNLVLGFVVGVQGGIALGLLLSVLPLHARPAIHVSLVRRHATTITVQTRNRHAAEVVNLLTSAGAVKAYTLRGTIAPDSISAALDIFTGSQAGVGFRTV